MPEADEHRSVSIVDEPAASKPTGGIWKRLRKGLSKTREVLTTDLDELFGAKQTLDDDLLEQLEELLITAAIGVQTSLGIIDRVTGKSAQIKDAGSLKAVLQEEFVQLMSESARAPVPTADRPYVIMVVGVNGVGKTTTIGKLAAQFAANGQKILVVAADTFRAAAIEQLAIWSERAGADIVKHKDGADPAAVTYDGMQAAIARKSDIVLVDTAGRLHTKVNLMEELKKIRRTVTKIHPAGPHEILLVLDATTGQNALSQAQQFHQALGVTGIALTKLDGTAKGGIVISITKSLNIPIQYIGVGETIEDLQTFDPQQYARAMFES